MKKLTILWALLAAVTVMTSFSACGHNDKDEADQLISEDKDITNKANANIAELHDRFGINLSPRLSINVKDAADNFPWATYPDNLKEIREKLVLAVSLANRTDEIHEHKNITVLMDNGVSAQSRTNAKLYLDSLDAYEAAHPSK